MSSLQLGNSVLAHRYAVRSNLRQGSYAELYEAWDQKQQCKVVVKALNTRLRVIPDRLLEEKLIHNFRQEAKLQKVLRHSHIVELLDEGIGVNRHGISFHYLVMEYLPGGDLESYCKARPLSLPQAVQCFSGVISALAAAHKLDIIHRDLKPANLLLSADRDLKVADFGVARLVANGQARLITRVGTGIYSPPEHNPDLEGKIQPLTPASDIYSLAKTMYAALTGRAPSQFRAKKIDTLPPDISEQPWAPKLLSVLQRATAESVDERYDSVKDFWRDFADVLSNTRHSLTSGDDEVLTVVGGRDKSRAVDPPARRHRLVIDLLPLKTRTLEFVTVDNAGRVVAKSRGEARYFVDDIAEGINIEMIRISGGRYLMGSPDSESERNNSEGPRRWVSISSFLVGRFPVTQEQWRNVARLPRLKYELDPAPSIFRGESLPVENVSWFEAVEFCERLTRKTGRKYRLPSEAEWEYACRAGSIAPFHFGETISPELANYDSKLPYRSAPGSTARNRTVRVDEVAPNAFGVIGMHGNVWEWCADTWHEDYKNAPSEGHAWLWGGNDALRIVRGGSWFNAAWLCRSAYRYAFDVNSKGHNGGFRLGADL